MLETEAGISILTLLQGLGYCLVVFFIGIHLYKKYVLRQDGPVKRRMRVVERLPLSSKSTLLLIEIDGRPVLLTFGSERTAIFSEPLIEGDALAESFQSFEESQKLDLCQSAN